MINITLIGQDIFLAAEIDKGMLKSLAKLYEVKEEEIIVSAHESFLYHDGVEQTSYHLLVRVEASKKYGACEELVAKYLLHYLKKYAIHIRVYFVYFSEENYYEEINEDYPLYLKESNIVEEDFPDSSQEEEDEEIYHGNIFEEFDKLVKEQEEKDSCVDGCLNHHHHD